MSETDSSREKREMYIREKGRQRKVDKIDESTVQS